MGSQAVTTDPPAIGNLNALRQSASFISEDILNYEPPSTRAKQGRVLARSSRLASTIGTPTRMPDAVEVAHEGELVATSTSYTWACNTVNAGSTGADFRFRICGRTLAVDVGVGPEGPLIRSLVLPADADTSNLSCSLHAGVASFVVGKKNEAADPPLSSTRLPSAETLAMRQSTEEMMLELSNMLEQNSGVLHDGPTTQPLAPSGSATVSLETSMPTSRETSSGEAAGTEHGIAQPSPRAHTAGDAATTISAQAAAPVESMADQRKSCADGAAASGEVLSDRPPFAEKDPPKLQLDAPHTELERHRSLASYAHGTNSTAPSPSRPHAESEVLKRCQSLLKRSQEQSKKLMEDASIALSAEGTRATLASALLPAPRPSSTKCSSTALPRHSSDFDAPAAAAELPSRHDSPVKIQRNMDQRLQDGRHAHMQPGQPPVSGDSSLRWWKGASQPPSNVTRAGGEADLAGQNAVMWDSSQPYAYWEGPVEWEGSTIEQQSGGRITLLQSPAIPPGKRAGREGAGVEIRAHGRSTGALAPGLVEMQGVPPMPPREARVCASDERQRAQESRARPAAATCDTVPSDSRAQPANPAQPVRDPLDRESGARGGEVFM